MTTACQKSIYLSLNNLIIFYYIVLNSFFTNCSTYSGISTVIRKLLNSETFDLCSWLSVINPLAPELNPSAQRCLTIFLLGILLLESFISLICMKNQQMQQLFVQFNNCVWYLLHVSALHCHLQGAFLVPSERCSIKEQSKEYCGWARCV
jgi:hypothetical protein